MAGDFEAIKGRLVAHEVLPSKELVMPSKIAVFQSFVDKWSFLEGSAFGLDDFSVSDDEGGDFALYFASSPWSRGFEKSEFRLSVFLVIRAWKYLGRAVRYVLGRFRGYGGEIRFEPR